MIHGIGTDICDVRRIRQTLQRQGERFAEKVLTEREQAEWRARSQPRAERGERFLATRFAAKEAFSKAIGLGFTGVMTWHNCEIGALTSGQPTIVLHGALKDWFDGQQLRAHVSLTDETDYAAAFVVVEKT
jgi:holo-[acyl-carrier-protein] synthase